MGHLRQNILTEQWIVFAAERSQRPDQIEKKKLQTPQSLPEKDSSCPFCPGNENMVPEIVDERQCDSNYKWATRVVPNKYPALTAEGNAGLSQEGIYLKNASYGRHEVIIESPFHNHDIPVMGTEQIECILDTYVRRFKAIFEDEDISHILIFRNHGPASGTSLVHPHSQIIGSAVIPKYIHYRQTYAENYYETKNICSLCHIIEHETHESKRIIFENDSFVVFVPYAAEVSGEVWIVPKDHQGHFGHVREKQIADLAQVLNVVLSAYCEKLENPDYNYMIYSGTRDKSDKPYVHWYIQIRPRMTIAAGFEIGSGMGINTSLPEHDAAILREYIQSRSDMKTDKKSAHYARVTGC